MRLGQPGREKPAVRHDGRIYDLSGLTADIDGSFLEARGIDTVRSALAEKTLPELDGADGLRVGPPVARPGAVVCVGQNYAADTGDPPPSTPIIFLKHPNTVVGPHDDVVIPLDSEKVDWEVELAVVIGRRASNLAGHEEAMACIAGFTVSNDVTERDFQISQSGGQWSKGKCCPTFNPLGPALVPADELGDPQALRLYSTVNGEARQDSTTADMVFSVVEIIRHLSHYMVLDPGDIINTGTPQGVALSGYFPYLRAGDTMTIGIEGLGEQHQKLVRHAEMRRR